MKSNRTSVITIVVALLIGGSLVASRLIPRPD